MDGSLPESVKRREIGFCDPHPDPQQARSAALLLTDIDGILQVSTPDPKHNNITVVYDLEYISLWGIEALLTEFGFHLDNSLLSKLKRALYYYTEDNETQSLHIHDDQDASTREIFMRCYRDKEHGCRDLRPEHWRNYL